jgi:CBS domain-containing protein
VSVLLEHDIGGAPVVDDDNRPVGLLSDGDLVVRQGYLHVPSVYSLFLERGYESPSPSVVQFDIELRKALGSTVGEVMDPNPVTCLEDETIEDIATRMLDCGVRRLPVVREGRLVGIVARGDLLRLLASRLSPDDQD